jgi:hypothetical protein
MEPKTERFWMDKGFKFASLSNCPACGAATQLWESPAKQMVHLDKDTLETHFHSCPRAREHRTEMQMKAGML